MSCRRRYGYPRELTRRYAIRWRNLKWPQVEEFGWPPGYLTDDYGGHPFLIRQVCSELHKLLVAQKVGRPCGIRKESYRAKRADLALSMRDYVDLILRILIDRYPDEYKLLLHLAAEDHPTFDRYANDDPSWISHLRGYGLISKEQGRYYFRIMVVRDRVNAQARKLRAPDSDEGRWSILSEERNRYESRLKMLVRTQLKIALGVKRAKAGIMAVMAKASQKTKAETLSYEDIFMGELYFSDLQRLIEAEWAIFENVFKNDMVRFSQYMVHVNKFRADAHANPITKAEFDFVMPGLHWLNDCLDENC